MMRRRNLISMLSLAPFANGQSTERKNGLATNVYPWMTFARRSGEKFIPHSDELMAAIRRTGIKGYEPIVTGMTEFEGLGDRLKKHGLEMKSLYVNSILHEKRAIEKSSANVLAVAREAKKIGTRIIVTNPSPIQWGGEASKSDSQLELQAEALNDLGKALKKEGLVLAYHNHDMELRHGAREFHHMLGATNPESVRFCLDSHWIYRGCGNSQVALFDSLERYGDRIEELHLRQSTGGIWNEVFSMKGDIDYVRIFQFLTHKKLNPHLVLEQAVEDGSPHQFEAEEAHAASRLAIPGN